MGLKMEDIDYARVKDDILQEDYNHEDFICSQLEKLPLFSIWDSCFQVAFDMLYCGSIPDCINGLNKEELEAAADDNPNETFIALLQPVQLWLSDKILIAMKKNEIKPILLSISIDGKIDVKRTYVDLVALRYWFTFRGIDLSHDYDTYFLDHYQDTIGRIYALIIKEVKYLSGIIYEPQSRIHKYYDDKVNWEEKYLNLKIENRRLKAGNTQNIRPHGNIERFAKNREQILGAALSVIIQWPVQCQNISGKFEATKIAKLVDDKSYLFWPETREPPLSLEKMEREINKWINKSGK